MKSRWIRPDGTEEHHDTPGEPSLDEMQKFVGGFIELVTVLYKGKKCHMIVNENGIAEGLPVNETATEIYYAASRARGVEPTDDAQREADSKAQLEGLAKNLGVKPEDITQIKLGPPGAPKIHGPAIVLEGRLS